MNLPSPSELERIAMCLTSEVLPQTRQLSGEAARKGTTIHRFLQRCLEVGRDAALSEAEEEDIDVLECIDVAMLPASQPGSFAPEVTFAYHPWTEESRVLGQDLERREARELAVSLGLSLSEWMIGTVDVVGVEDGATALVWDYKTGRGHVTKASENWQAWTYLLMVARAFGLRRARGGIIRTNESETRADRCSMDDLDLAAHASRLRELLDARRVAIDNRDRIAHVPLEGPHCRYCPAADRCPPRIAGALVLATGSTEAAAQHFELTPALAAVAWQRLKNAQHTLDRMRAMVVELARAAPIDLGDGFVLGERCKSSESILAERSRKVLIDLHGPDLGAIVYGSAAKKEETLTKAALRKALARYVLPVTPDGKITHINNAALVAMRAAQAMSVTQSTTVDERRADDAPAASSAE